MPTSYIKKLHKEGKGSISELEKKWDKAKAIAEGEGKTKDWGYIMGIFKKELNLAHVTATATPYVLLASLPVTPESRYAFSTLFPSQYAELGSPHRLTSSIRDAAFTVNGSHSLATLMITSGLTPHSMATTLSHLWLHSAVDEKVKGKRKPKIQTKIEHCK